MPDLENGPLGHLPSGRFNANAAWLVLAAAAFNLMRMETDDPPGPMNVLAGST